MLKRLTILSIVCTLSFCFTYGCATSRLYGDDEYDAFVIHSTADSERLFADFTTSMLDYYTTHKSRNAVLEPQILETIQQVTNLSFSLGDNYMDRGVLHTTYKFSFIGKSKEGGGVIEVKVWRFKAGVGYNLWIPVTSESQSEWYSGAKKFLIDQAQKLPGSRIEEYRIGDLQVIRTEKDQ